MARRRRAWWLLTAVGLVLGGCSGDDSSPAGPGGSSASGGNGGAGGAGGSSDPGGAGGSTSGGTAGSGGEAGSSGAGGEAGSPDAGSGGTAGTGSGDAASETPPTEEGGEAGRCLPAGTISVVNEASDGYLFDGGPLNPVLTLCRGSKYTFTIDAPGHPIYIRQQNGTSFVDGVTGNHISSGNLVFDVPLTAPGMLFYQCDIHDAMTGAIVIVD